MCVRMVKYAERITLVGSSVIKPAKQYPCNKEPRTTECQGNRLKRLPLYLACKPAMVLGTADSSGTADKSERATTNKQTNSDRVLHCCFTLTIAAPPVFTEGQHRVGQHTSAAQIGLEEASHTN